MIMLPRCAGSMLGLLRVNMSLAALRCWSVFCNANEFFKRLSSGLNLSSPRVIIYHESSRLWVYKYEQPEAVRFGLLLAKGRLAPGKMVLIGKRQYNLSFYCLSLQTIVFQYLFSGVESTLPIELRAGYGVLETAGAPVEFVEGAF